MSGQVFSVVPKIEVIEAIQFVVDFNATAKCNCGVSVACNKNAVQAFINDGALNLYHHDTEGVCLILNPGSIEEQINVIPGQYVVKTNSGDILIMSQQEMEAAYILGVQGGY